jgi:Transposase DDE domain
MTHESLTAEDFDTLIDRLGGAERLAVSARETGALVRRRGFANAVALLRTLLLYCLTEMSLRSTAALAEGSTLASVSSVALWKRMAKATGWLELLVTSLLLEQCKSAMPPAAKGRLLRCIDATTLPHTAKAAKARGELWRLHCAYDPQRERFSAFELTTERGGETLDRIAVVRGEIRLADRAHMQPDRMARVIDQGGDFIIRAPWSSVRWLDGQGQPLDLIALLRDEPGNSIDRAIKIARKNGEPLDLRLVVRRKSPEAAEKARLTARHDAKRKGHEIKPETLVAAEWIILVTTLAAAEFKTEEILDLYRVRWRIEIAFKRLKSGAGLGPPPSENPAVAKTYIYCHLLMALIAGSLISEIGVSPRRAAAPIQTSGAPSKSSTAG